MDLEKLIEDNKKVSQRLKTILKKFVEDNKELSQRLITILPDEDNFIGMMILLKNNKNCIKLNEFFKKHADLDSDDVWRKVISITRKG